MNNTKAALVADLRDLVERLEEDTSEGECLPHRLLLSLRSEVHASYGFMKKRRRKQSGRSGFSHNLRVRIGRLN